MRGAQTGLPVAGRLTMHWQGSEQIIQTLETAFKHILDVRMRDVPIINPALAVQAIGFETFADAYPGVLITPWCMNLMLFPHPDSAWLSLSAGHQFEQTFPSGSFMFTLATEPQLGAYAQCSLFSPMFEFEDQAAALAAAQAALQGLLTIPAPRAVSRRALLRGQIGKQ